MFTDEKPISVSDVQKKKLLREFNLFFDYISNLCDTHSIEIDLFEQILRFQNAYQVSVCIESNESIYRNSKNIRKSRYFFNMLRPKILLSSE